MSKIALLLLFISFPLGAVVTMPTITDKVKTDGDLDDHTWQQAAKIDLPYEIEPSINTPASVITTLYLLDTGESLIIGFDAQDPNPVRIVVNRFPPTPAPGPD